MWIPVRSRKNHQTTINVNAPLVVENLIPTSEIKSLESDKKKICSLIYLVMVSGGYDVTAIEN